MAFITLYNTLKIVRRNNLKKLKIAGEIYKTKIYIFSRYEENSLLAIQELMKKPSKYFSRVYDPLVINDSKKYIYKEKQPAYHTHEHCDRLNADFTNFQLPEVIKERGELEIERFRTWFMQNSYLLERPDVFVMRIKAAFNIVYNPKSINYDNSGFTDFKNYTLFELEDKIDTLLKDAGKYYYTSEKHKAILKSFGKITGVAFSEKPLYNNSTGYNDKEVKEFLKDYYLKYKGPIKKFLIEYYRVKLNPKLRFAENFLEALGFKICSSCRRTQELEFFNNLSENDKWGYVSENMCKIKT